MKKIINHLRKQPVEVRKNIIRLCMVVFSIILFMLWIYSLSATLSKDFQKSTKESFGPFSALKDNIIDGYKSIKEVKSTQETYEESKKEDEIVDLKDNSINLKQIEVEQ